MWEVMMGEIPFGNHKHNLGLSFAIVKGRRPKIDEGVPHEYVTLMRQCWDANPEVRPDAFTIMKKIGSLYNEMIKQQELNIIRSKSLKSKVKNLLKSKISKDNQEINYTNTKRKIYKIPNSKVLATTISIRPRNTTDGKYIYIIFCFIFIIY